MLLKYSPQSKHSQKLFIVGTGGICLFARGLGSSSDNIRVSDFDAGALPGNRKLCRWESTFDVQRSNSALVSPGSNLFKAGLFGGTKVAEAVNSERKI
jgi:hypothetical protein